MAESGRAGNVIVSCNTGHGFERKVLNKITPINISRTMPVKNRNLLNIAVICYFNVREVNENAKTRSARVDFNFRVSTTREPQRHLMIFTFELH
jgi:hypothetical protein